MKNLLFALIGLVVILGITYATLSISYQNDEQALRNKITASVDVGKASISRMQNIIFGSAEVANKYGVDMTKLHKELMNGRYKKGSGQMMLWIKESHPNYDASLLKSVQQAIKSERTSFHYEQVQRINLGLQHDNLLTLFPSKFFLSDKLKIDIPVIKNEGVNEIFETGIEPKKSLF